MRYKATINGKEVEAVPMCHCYEDEWGISHYSPSMKIIFDHDDECYETIGIPEIAKSKNRGIADAAEFLERLGFEKVSE